jgi:hypothetical protein
MRASLPRLLRDDIRGKPGFRDRYAGSTCSSPTNGDSSPGLGTGSRTGSLEKREQDEHDADDQPDADRHEEPEAPAVLTRRLLDSKGHRRPVYAAP